MPRGTMMSAPAPLLKLASITAARKVQWLLAEWHRPLPGLSSTSSRVLLTLNVAMAGAASASRARGLPSASTVRLHTANRAIFFSIACSSARQVRLLHYCAAHAPTQDVTAAGMPSVSGRSCANYEGQSLAVGLFPSVPRLLQPPLERHQPVPAAAAVDQRPLVDQVAVLAGGELPAAD